MEDFFEECDAQICDRWSKEKNGFQRFLRTFVVKSFYSHQETVPMTLLQAFGEV